MNLPRGGRHAAPFILLAILSAGFLFIIVPGTTAQQILTGASPTFNEYGRLVSTDSYIEIRAAQLYRAGAYYVAKIFVNGTLPKDIEVDGRIRWEILLDTDQNPRTKYAQWTNFSLIDNGIGVDAEAFVEIDYYALSYFGQIRTSNAVNTMPFIMNATTVQMYVDANLIGNPPAFDFVMLVRKWIGVHMVGADKIPNVGHFTYKNGAVTTIPSTSTQTQASLATQTSTSTFSTTFTINSPTTTQTRVELLTQTSTSTYSTTVTPIPEFNTSLQVMILLVTLTASAAAIKTRRR